MLARRARPSMSDHVEERAPERSNPAAGALWARRIGCTGCHRAASGEAGVPDLTRVGMRHDAAWLRPWITQPDAVDPAANMPAFGEVLKDAELTAIVDYLAARK